MEINRIYQGNCMDIMKEWVSNEDNWFKIQMILTDPPYEVDYGDKSAFLSNLGKASDKQINRDKNYIEINEKFDYRKFCQYLYILLKNNSMAYIWHGDTQMFKFYRYMTESKFMFNQILVWSKNSSTFDATFGLKYMYKHELCSFYRKGFRKLNNPDETVFNYKVMQSMVHPTIKPLELFMRLIENSTKPGDLVFDPFMGSGTTAVAAKLTGRNYIGCELSPYFHELCRKRLQKETIEQQSILKVLD